MKILVTGGSGFIGVPVLMSLIENINLVEILNLTRTSSKAISKQIENYQCDLSDPQTYLNKVNEFKPEVVIHLAWEGIPDFSLEMSTKNILSSISFIEIVTKLKSCKKIIVTGSCFEYNNKFGPCSENQIVVPKDYFTFAKKTILSFLKLECNKSNIIFIWARLFYVYGPNQRNASLVPTLIEALKNSKIPDIRTPKNANDFVYVDDVARGIIEMAKKEIPSGVYNLGNGFSITILEICKICEIALCGAPNLSNRLEILTQNTIKTGDFWSDNYKLKKLLNWNPITTFELGVKKIINNQNNKS